MKALIIGATGATGKDLLQLLLADDAFQEVVIFVRRKPDFEHEKLTAHIIDFDKTDDWSHLVEGDVLFSCLGTTLKDAGSKEAQWKVDYDYQYNFAKAASTNGVPAYILVSSVSAAPDSFFFYMKMKGQLEEAVKRLNFKKLVIFRPPTLKRSSSARTGEVLGVKVLNFFNRLGLFKSAAPMSTVDLAEAMIGTAKDTSNGLQIAEGQGVLDFQV